MNGEVTELEYVLLFVFIVLPFANHIWREWIEHKERMKGTEKDDA